MMFLRSVLSRSPGDTGTVLTVARTDPDGFRLHAISRQTMLAGILRGRVEVHCQAKILASTTRGRASSSASLPPAGLQCSTEGLWTEWRARRCATTAFINEGSALDAAVLPGDELRGTRRQRIALRRTARLSTTPGGHAPVQTFPPEVSEVPGMAKNRR